ncbi:MAG: phosphomannomutase/phosphoglucomutase [Candidatus Aenigmarchaeota archaeon]|nr:phosphomannomutase/phosphoglucomutase [Candidatus Aenigmarchaeota archaeon]
MENADIIFRTNDIRGVYGRDFDDDTAEKLGKAFGSFIGPGKRVVISRDVRPTGEKLKERMISGMLAVGCDVVDIGMSTTPMMYFAVHQGKFDAGVSVTASHNPSDWNGFKLVGPNASQFYQGGGLERIKKIFVDEDFSYGTRTGTSTKSDVTEEYVGFLLSRVKARGKLNIVIDPGNGAACGIAEAVLRKAGHAVVVINGEPDGTFPSRPSDPSEKNVARLKSEVLARGADMGMAFDGDVDRIALVDNLGRYVSSGNITIPIFARHYLRDNKGGKVVYDVCCSSCVEESIRDAGGVPVVSKVGQPAIKGRMAAEGAVFGGEYSSHLNFAEIHSFDDALYAGLKMAEIVSSEGRTLAKIVDSVPVYPTSELREVHCDDDIKFDVVKKVSDHLKKNGFRTLDIDGVKAYSEDGWVLIRASNTMSTIKMNAEARSPAEADRLLEMAVKSVRDEIGRRK